MSPTRRRAVLAGALGAAWGLICYSVLWGYSPFFPSRSFVLSPLGTLLLLPMRLVLQGIRLLESGRGRAFELADSHGWIGVASAVVGAALALAAWLAFRGARRIVARRAPER